MIVPFLWADFTVDRQFPIFTHGFSLSDLEDKFRVYIPAVLAFPFVGIHIIAESLKVGEGVDGVSVINRISAFIHDQQNIEKLVNI